jgi:hypothetical protein
MGWLSSRRAEAQAPGAGCSIQPVPLRVMLDSDVLRSKLQQLIAHAGGAGGLAPLVAALEAKHRAFVHALAPERIASMSQVTWAELVNAIFPARRRLGPAVAATEPAARADAIGELLLGTGPLQQRMATFARWVPTTDRKQRRAAWDMAAELLHFFAPQCYPLMTRWVWDSSTVSGALREFIREGDQLREVPLDPSPGTFEAVRRWMADELAGEGFYRDMPFVIDLVLAQAYSEYAKGMMNGFHVLTPDFGAKDDPLELVQKLLGIDAKPRSRAGQRGVGH